jgi:uncharacterized protein (DUF2141 family)
MRVKGLKYFSGYLLLAAIFFSCAKQSAPVGGPVDEEPPVVVSSIPPAGTVNFSVDNFEVTFDEYFVLDGVDQKLLVSPPLEKRPEIKIRKKSLIVTFGEELRDSATYTFYFQDAVRDLNEGNPIENFQYVFSTGPVLDSLSVYGTIYKAFDLQPGENIFVVLYSGTSDTLPSTTIPTYVTRAEKDGSFRINNLAGGVYTMYGLRDMNNNKRYDLPDESFAFMDRPIFLSAETHYTPVADTSVAPGDTLLISDSILLSGSRGDSSLVILSDTLVVSDSLVVYDTLLVLDPGAGNDTLMVADSLTRSDMLLVADSLARSDTLMVSDSLLYMIPDSAQQESQADSSGIFSRDNGYSLYFFEAAAERLYLTRSERTSPYRLTFVFSMPVDSGMFNISFPDTPGTEYIERVSSARDTFNIWLMDSLIYSQPVVPVVINYPAIDSAGVDITASDTLRMRYIQPARGRGTQAEKPLGTRINVTPAPGKGLPPGSRIIFRAETPLSATDTSRILLKQISDTLLKDIPYTFTEDSIAPDRFIFQAEMFQDSSYLLIYDSGSFTDIYGNKNDSATYRFKVRNQDSFGNLILRLNGFHGNMIIQLLSKDEKIIEEQRTLMPEGNLISFNQLEPGEYRLKAVYDINGDGKWSTGDWESRLKPEPVTYYPDPISLKALWTIEQEWDLSNIYFKSESMRNPEKEKAATEDSHAADRAGRTPVSTGGRSGAVQR